MPIAISRSSFSKQMVSIPSVTGDEGKIQKFLANYLKKIGLEVDMWESIWEELKKHPGYIPVERGYEGRPISWRSGRAPAAAARCYSMATPTSSRSAMARAGATIPGRRRSRTAGFTDAAPAT